MPNTPTLPNFVVYLYNDKSGVIAWFPKLVADAQLALPIGWHGPFQTHQEAVDFYNNNHTLPDNIHWKAPNFDIGTAMGNAGQTASENAADVIKKLDPLAKYDLNNWLLRIGEILLGLVLLGIGLAKLTGASNVISKVAKVAI